MPGLLTLTTAINVRNVVKMQVVGGVHVDEVAGELVVVVATTLVGALPYTTHALHVHNGDAEGIRAKATPTGAGDAVETFLTSTGMGTAFTDCYADYKSGGRNSLIARLQTLGLLPAGTVT